MRAICKPDLRHPAPPPPAGGRAGEGVPPASHGHATKSGAHR